MPITQTCVKTMYVFVDIELDLDNLVNTIELNFPDKTHQIHFNGLNSV